MQKVAIVTGSSNGIGLETVLALAKNGYITYATMRKIKPITMMHDHNLKIKTLELDVNDNLSVKSAIKRVSDENNGKIDVVINNAGYGLFGGINEVSIDDIKNQFETNFFGTIRVMKEIIPIMKKNKTGIIINISSLAGIIGFPYSIAYVSSKFAIEGMSECSRYELEKYGIRMIIIEPGVTKTNFFMSIKTSNKKRGVSTKNTDNIIKNLQNIASTIGTDAKHVANIIISAIEDPKPKLRYIVGNDAHMILNMKKEKNDEEF